MANKAFEIQESKLRIGGLDLEAGATAIAIPGLSQAANFSVDEVDEVDGDFTLPSFNASTVIVIDNAQYRFYAGTFTSSPQYQAAQYIVELDDGEIDEIQVDVEGLFSSADRTLATGNVMWATDVADATSNFNTSDWVEIPFRPKMRAGEVETIGGGADLGDFSIAGSELSAEQMTIKTTDGDITIESDSSVLVDVAGGTLRWSFANDGILTLPEGGDIVNSTGSSVLGGGGSSFTVGTVNLHNGGDQTAQILQFTDDRYQAVITGPAAEENNDAQRLIIQGQKGTGTGEGGDVYLWGGDAQHDGGDIKIYAGDADSGTEGDEGGYINIQAGRGYSDGGDVTITGGYSQTGSGGRIRLEAGNSGNSQLNGEIQLVSYNKQWTFNRDGILTLPSDNYLETTDSNLKIGSQGSVIIRSNAATDVGTLAWEFDIRGALRLPEGGDILDSNGDSVLGSGSGATTVARQDTPPATGNGTLWYNTVEGRLYIKYDDAWVDAAPLMMPVPQVDIDVATITFPDATVQTTAWTGTGSFTNSVIQEGNFDNENPVTSITGLADTGISLTSDKWAQLMWVPDATTVSIDDISEGPNVYNWAYVEDTGFKIENKRAGEPKVEWNFDRDGSLTLPGAVVNSTVAKTGGGEGTETALDLTKTVNKLTDGGYTLADGVEGQIMYLVRQTSSVAANIGVLVAHARVNGSTYSDHPHYPFSGGGDSLTTMIFTDGHWQSTNGAWD